MTGVGSGTQELPPFQPANGDRVSEQKRQIWSIGIYSGASLIDLHPAADVSNPVLSRESITDIPALFVADPFMVNVDGTWHLFFEVLNQKTGKGEIGLATSNDTVHWQYHRIVLTEPFHLSYPYVFGTDNTFYMIPETYQANSVRLYRAKHFPHDWTYVADLLAGEHFVDPTVFEFAGKWWLMIDLATPPFYAGTLRLFLADRLLGPWIEHPESPVVDKNPHIARPAGGIVAVNSELVRFTQDCSPVYGTQVRAFKITSLTSTAYKEEELHPKPVLQASGKGWNKLGMHHIDCHFTGTGHWVACVDGWEWER